MSSEVEQTKVQRKHYQSLLAMLEAYPNPKDPKSKQVKEAGIIVAIRHSHLLKS